MKTFRLSHTQGCVASCKKEELVFEACGDCFPNLPFADKHEFDKD
jgi:hypothetical protein